MIYLCCDEHRRDAVRALHTLRGIDFNGIDFLEVEDTLLLKVHLIHPLETERIKQKKTTALNKENVSITGGERTSDVTVVKVTVDKDNSRILEVTADKPGDFSTYTLHLNPDPDLLVLDSQLAAVDFTFNTANINSLDCKTDQVCEPEPVLLPEIDYLAKDFNSFRLLMLDRLTVLMPQWYERSAADIGVMLVEILAYVGDHLSYQQDVIATESYLSTARRRISVRRHARLLDYPINEGCNARVWAQVHVTDDIGDDKTPALPQGTQLLTKAMGQNAPLLPRDALQQALSTQPTLFETMYRVDRLYKNHNALSFYTWGARECCLPVGATQATLKGAYPNLQVGDILIFKEVLGAHTGKPEDAEPAHRLAVRLTKVSIMQDPLGAWFTQPHPTGEPEEGRVEEETRITETERLVEEITYRQGDDVSHETRITEEKHVIDEERVIEGGQVVQDKIEEKDDITEQPTVKLPAIKPKMQYEQEPHSGRSASGKGRRQVKRGKKKGEQEKEPEEEVEEFEEEEHSSVSTSSEEGGTSIEEEETTDETIERTVERKVIEEKDIGIRETDVLTETDTVEEEVIRKKEEPNYSVDITEIEWDYEDRLPFPLCVSVITDYEYGHQYLEDVSIALGNIVLADQGFTYKNQAQALLPNIVPQSVLNQASTAGGDRCDKHQPVPIPPRFYPHLQYGPLTYAVPYNGSNPLPSATATMQFNPQDAVPAIALTSTTGPRWQPRRDLLSSRPTDAHFVVENETDGTAYLRFGDGQLGLQPDAGTTFSAAYRIGNGIGGNISADALMHIVSDDARIDAVNNPLPASGGVNPESIESVRQNVAGVFSQQERGVTPDDYRSILLRRSDIHRANAILRWTGSWYTMFLVLERVGGLLVDAAFRDKLCQEMEQYRMVGTDLVIVSPVYVPLEIGMTVIAQPDYLPGDVKADLLKFFSNRQWPDGVRGLFYPDNYPFGQPVYLNILYQAANAVPGIAALNVQTFQRLGIPGRGLIDGVLAMDWLEIARLDNDPNNPEHGILNVEVTYG